MLRQDQLRQDQFSYYSVEETDGEEEEEEEEKEA